MGGFAGNIINGVVIGAWVIIGLGIFGVVGFVLYNLKAYPIKIRIFERIGKTFREIKGDRAKVIKHESGAMILKGRNKSNGINFTSIKYEHMYPTHKGGYVLELLKTEKGNYDIIDRQLTDEALLKFTFNQVPHALNFWNNVVKRAARDKYSKKGWRDILLPLVALSGIALVFLMQVVSWHYFTKLNETYLGEARALRDGAAANNPTVAPPPQQIQPKTDNPNMPEAVTNLPFGNTIAGAMG